MKKKFCLFLIVLTLVPFALIFSGCQSEQNPMINELVGEWTACEETKATNNERFITNDITIEHISKELKEQYKDTGYCLILGFSKEIYDWYLTPTQKVTRQTLHFSDARPNIYDNIGKTYAPVYIDFTIVNDTESEHYNELKVQFPSERDNLVFYFKRVS